MNFVLVFSKDSRRQTFASCFAILNGFLHMDVSKEYGDGIKQRRNRKLFW